jgi:hypothetical protein
VVRVTSRPFGYRGGVARALGTLLVVLAVVPVASGSGPFAARPLKVRPAVPADDYSKPGATEWWQLLAFDPGSRTVVRAVFMSRPLTNFRITVLRRNEAASVLAGDGMAIVRQSSPGVAMVGTSPPPGAEPPRASLRYKGGSYVVEARSGAGAAHLEIFPKRAGPTVGPWQLGPHKTSWNPPAFVPGRRTWSAPVATGSASGWIEVDGRRLSFRRWRAYQDHTWGQFSLAESNWVHSDFAVVSPRAGEAWILNGLEASDGAYRTQPNDRLWQGVLVHARGKSLVTCSARVHRSRWTRNISSGWFYLLPDVVQAGCARAGSFAFRPAGGFRGVDGFGIAQEVGGSKPTRGGTGWIAHATPPVPNS